MGWVSSINLLPSSASNTLDVNSFSGRYQWWIWGLCGFGYFLDLMWAQAFGLILTQIIPEFGLYGDRAVQAGNLSTSFSAGLTAGAFVWGVLVDVVGRYSGAR